MPSFCGVIGCGNRAERDVKSFYRLPGIPKRGSQERNKLIEERRRRWINALKRADLNETKMKNLRICEDHFISGKPSALDDTVNPDWVPSRNMGYGNTSDDSTVERFNRRKKRRVADDAKTTDENPASEDDREADPENQIDEDPATEDEADPENQIPVNRIDVSVQTDLTMEDIDTLNKVCQDLQGNVTKIQDSLQKLSLDEDSFKNDEEKGKYYTGIPTFVTLSIIYDLINPYLTETSLTALTKFQKYILTLMHLRLNLDFTDLAYRFGISKSTASRIFTECLHVLHERLFNTVFWPEREVLMTKVPLTFLETFGRKVTVIIDCFETKIEKPGNLIAAAQCYSHYKHHHTIKYLIGISPQGAIIFISSAWGGRTSDKHIVQNSGFLEQLLPGDLVLADRGFNVQDEVGLYCAELKLPTYTRGKKQLDPMDIEATRKLAHVRIHVERVIGQLRQKYRILSDVMPISMVKKANSHSHSTVDQIVRVCCALVNCMPSVIPME